MNEKLRIGMFGGTFDPIHKGHIRAALEFYKAADLSKMYVIPTGIPPHKKRLVTDSCHRLEMARLAFEDCDKRVYNIEISDIETSKEGKSYTFLTVSELAKRNKCDRIYVYTGTDMFCCLEKWFNAQELFRLCVFCVCPRDRGEMSVILECDQRYKKLYDAKSVVMNVPPLEMSSTEIRELVGEQSGQCDGEADTNKIFNMLTKSYLTEKVAKYIIDNELYFRSTQEM